MQHEIKLLNCLFKLWAVSNRIAPHRNASHRKASHLADTVLDMHQAKADTQKLAECFWLAAGWEKRCWLRDNFQQRFGKCSQISRVCLTDGVGAGSYLYVPGVGQSPQGQRHTVRIFRVITAETERERTKTHPACMHASQRDIYEF